MDPLVWQLFSAGLADSTRKTYNNHFGLTPYPTSENTLSYFVAFLFKEGLAPSSVKSYLSAVRHTQIALGLGDPHLSTMPRLEYFTKGLRRLSSGQSRSRLPITPAILRCLRASWEKAESYFDGVMLWAAACMCFFGFLRSGEIVVPSDLAFNVTSQRCTGG